MMSRSIVVLAVCAAGSHACGSGVLGTGGPDGAVPETGESSGPGNRLVTWRLEHEGTRPLVFVPVPRAPDASAPDVSNRDVGASKAKAPLAGMIFVCLAADAAP